MRSTNFLTLPRSDTRETKIIFSPSAVFTRSVLHRFEGLTVCRTALVLLLPLPLSCTEIRQPILSITSSILVGKCHFRHLLNIITLCVVQSRYNVPSLRHGYCRLAHSQRCRLFKLTQYAIARPFRVYVHFVLKQISRNTLLYKYCVLCHDMAELSLQCCRD